MVSQALIDLRMIRYTQGSQGVKKGRHEEGLALPAETALRPSHLLAAAVLLSNDLFSRAVLWPDIMVPSPRHVSSLRSLVLKPVPLSILRWTPGADVQAYGG